MPVHLGLFARIELQGHEHLLLAIGCLLYIPLYGAVVARKAVLIPQTLIHPIGLLTLLTPSRLVLLDPCVDDLLERIKNRPRARLA